MTSSTQITQVPKALAFDCIVLVCGLGLAAFARHEHVAERTAQVIAVASLDSAIVAALPAADGSGGGDSTRVVMLATQKRDMQIADDQRFSLWKLGYGGGIGMVIVALFSLARLGIVRVMRRGTLPRAWHTDA